jgi:hypothetical protein
MVSVRVPRERAERRVTKVYTTMHVGASLAEQPETVGFLEREFAVCIQGVIA